MNFSQFYFLTLKHWQSEPTEADSNEKLVEGGGGRWNKNELDQASLGSLIISTSCQAGLGQIF